MQLSFVHNSVPGVVLCRRESSFGPYTIPSLAEISTYTIAVNIPQLQHLVPDQRADEFTAWLITSGSLRVRNSLIRDQARPIFRAEAYIISTWSQIH